MTAISKRASFVCQTRWAFSFKFCFRLHCHTMIHIYFQRESLSVLFCIHSTYAPFPPTDPQISWHLHLSSFQIENFVSSQSHILCQSSLCYKTLWYVYFKLFCFVLLEKRQCKFGNSDCIQQGMFVKHGSTQGPLFLYILTPKTV